MKLLPKEISEQLATWRRAWRRWLAVHYLFGGLATVCTVLLALVRDQPAIPWLPLDLIAVVAVTTSGLTAFGRTKEQAGGYLRAFRKLNAASIRFINDQSYGVDKLLAVHDECEALIESADAV